MSRISCSSTSVRDVSGRREPAAEHFLELVEQIQDVHGIHDNRIGLSAGHQVVGRRVQADARAAVAARVGQRQAPTAAGGSAWPAVRGRRRCVGSSRPGVAERLDRRRERVRRPHTADRRKPGRPGTRTLRSAAATGAWCTRARSSSPVARRLDCDDAGRVTILLDELRGPRAAAERLDAQRRPSRRTGRARAARPAPRPGCPLRPARSRACTPAPRASRRSRP